MHWIAPAAKDTATATLEKELWAAADQLRANSGLTAAQYSQPVLGLIFLRFADAKFASRRAELSKATTGRRGSRIVFTLIHKFQTAEVLNDRRDVIVIVDEAHRSQYDRLALNMRTALPNALFVAFTGTPLIAGEERTKEVFGDYVSIYDFQQSVEDGATVPLFYENRTPELQLSNPALNDELYDVLDAADLDEVSQARLEQLLGQRYHLITRDDRLDTVAKDIVQHFLGRGFAGKAMVVSIDKATALRTAVRSPRRLRRRSTCRASTSRRSRRSSSSRRPRTSTSNASRPRSRRNSTG